MRIVAECYGLEGPLPRQVEAVYKFLLPLPKIRFLLADDAGASKTIMTGPLIKECFKWTRRN